MNEIYSRERAAGIDIENLNRLRILLCGAGNTGSHFVERAIRNMIKQLFIIDYDKEGYQPHNFAHSSTLLDPVEDVGKPKAETLAMRANEKLLTGGHYVGKTMNVRDIGPEVIRQFDMVLGFFDNIDARAYLYQIAREANVPFMEIGLSENGDWQLQIEDHALDAPCYCCNLGKREVAASCKYTYLNDVANGIAPVTDVSGAEAAACAMDALMRYFSPKGFECNVKFRFDSSKFSIDKLIGVKNPECDVCSCEAVDKNKLIHLEGSVDEVTYRRFEQMAREETGKELRFCLPDVFITKDYCPKCGKEKAFMRPEHRIAMSDVVCPECREKPGERFLALHVNVKSDWVDGCDEVPERLKDRMLYELGFAYGGHIVAMDDDFNEYYFTFDGDMKLLSDLNREDKQYATYIKSSASAT